MKITMFSAWIGGSDIRYIADSAKLEIENVGDLQIEATLPKSIKDQIEAYYVSVYHARMAAKLE